MPTDKTTITARDLAVAGGIVILPGGQALVVNTDQEPIRVSRLDLAQAQIKRMQDFLCDRDLFGEYEEWILRDA